MFQKTVRKQQTERKTDCLNKLSCQPFLFPARYTRSRDSQKLLTIYKGFLRQLQPDMDILIGVIRVTHCPAGHEFLIPALNLIFGIS